MHSRSVALCALLASSLLGAAAPAPVPPQNLDLTPHRAIYVIGLEQSSNGSGVSAAQGRMVFELTGSACAGYTMKQRLVVNLSDEEGNSSLLDFRISTFESGPGDLFQFDTETKVNDEVVEDLKGEAKRGSSAVDVTLEEPDPQKIALEAATLFPGQHLRAILEAARAEQRLVTAEIFEGAGSGNSADATTAMIGTAATLQDGQSLTRGVRSWPVSVGYFGDEKAAEHQDDFGEETPSYQMSFRLFENGVTEKLVMDYGSYSLSGDLERLEPLKAEACDKS